MVPCLRNHRLRLAKSRALGQRSAPHSLRVVAMGSLGGSGESVSLSPGPERPLGANVHSATVHPSLGPGDGTRRSGAAELHGYRQATAPPSPGFLVPWSDWARPRCPGAKSPGVPLPEREPDGTSRAARPSRPTWERRAGTPGRGTCQRPRPLRSQALPSRLPGRRSRHTWGASGSKLGGDVNGPARTSPRTRAAGQAGWDREKVARTPLRRPNDFGEGGGNRSDASSPLRPPPRAPPCGAGVGVGPRRPPGGVTDSSSRPDPG